MIKCFFTYSTMIIPPSNDCNWPNYQAALIIVDGYKPNPCGGGRNKNNLESRKQPLIKFISGSEGTGKDILRKMSEGLLNVLSQENHDKYKVAFSYNKHQANKISFVGTKKEQNLTYCQDKASDNKSYGKVLENYKPSPLPRGQNPPPYQFLYQCKNKKELKQKITEWKNFRVFTQDQFLKEYARMTDAIIEESISNATYIKNSQGNQGVFQENVAVRKHGSPPTRPEDVRDKKATSAREQVFKYLFQFIHATTRQAITSRGEETASWPVLSACVVIIDGYNPKRCGIGRQHRNAFDSKGKETIKVQHILHWKIVWVDYFQS